MPDITIPSAALEAGARAIASNLKTEWAYMLKEDRDWCRSNARAAFLAMIEAWPEMSVNRIGILLPLPVQENTDDKA